MKGEANLFADHLRLYMANHDGQTGIAVSDSEQSLLPQATSDNKRLLTSNEDEPKVPAKPENQ